MRVMTLRLTLVLACAVYATGCGEQQKWNSLPPEESLPSSTSSSELVTTTTSPPLDTVDLALPDDQVRMLEGAREAALPVPRMLPPWSGVRTFVGTGDLPPGVGVAAATGSGVEWTINIVTATPESTVLSDDAAAVHVWTTGAIELWSTTPPPCTAVPRESYLQFVMSGRPIATVSVSPAPGCDSTSPPLSDVIDLLSGLALCDVGKGSPLNCVLLHVTDGDRLRAANVLAPPG